MFLVTGSAGFIGSSFVLENLKKGIQVIGIDNLNDYYDVFLKKARLSNLFKYKNYKHFYIDIQNINELRKIFLEYRPSLVVNLAAQPGVRYSLKNPNSYIQNNIQGFLNILELSKESDCKKVIYASSSSVYGNNETPFSISQSVDRPLNIYAASKKMNELMAYSYSHLYGIKTTGLRFFTVYGPWGRPDMALFQFTKLILSNKKINVYNNGNHLRDFTYIDDVVTIMNLIVDQLHLKEIDDYRVFNIGNDSPIKLLDYIATLEKVLGKKAKIKLFPSQSGEIINTWADISDIEKEFDFRPQTKINDGIKRFVDWYCSYYKIEL